MKWFGKAIGGALGLVLGGPLGALFGLAVGHHYDQKGERSRGSAFRPDPELLELFFETLFAAMGRVAKSDGRVDEAEIAFAERFMHRMGMNALQRGRAISAFQRGKDPAFPLDRLLAAFRHRAARHPELLTLFLETLLGLARCDAPINETEERQLLLICRRLGLSTFHYLTLKMAVEGQFRFREGTRGTPPKREQLSRLEACRILGVPPSASKEEIKRAYRRLMSRYHPDKLAASGASRERIEAANERARKIRQAYEVLMVS